jgi:hypothetical protein
VTEEVGRLLQGRRGGDAGQRRGRGRDGGRRVGPAGRPPAGRRAAGARGRDDGSRSSETRPPGARRERSCEWRRSPSSARRRS